MSRSCLFVFLALIIFQGNGKTYLVKPMGRMEGTQNLKKKPEDNFDSEIETG